jgi:hypothetical protein
MATEAILENSFPSPEEKENLKIGDMAKLRFSEKEEDVECRWAQVSRIENTQILGVLQNDSLDLEELSTQMFFKSRRNRPVPLQI